MAQWVKGKVIDVEHWTDTLFRIKIKAPIAAFIPGQ
ncbi:MAG: ferredoxin--NADP(+) reductase, partial [Candidatus Regiella insecticola]|nr:ferredoxin--NADP(+) reductase [Candidatus Regiella insecticola]